MLSQETVALKRIEAYVAINTGFNTYLLEGLERLLMLFQNAATNNIRLILFCIILHQLPS